MRSTAKPVQGSPPTGKNQARTPGAEEPAARTPLGAGLTRLREAVVASGAPLLDWDELEGEMAARRRGAGEEA